MSLVRRSAYIVVLSASVAACSSSDDKPEAERESYLGLEAPAHGFQIRSEGEVIPPGADLEFCEVGELPETPDDIYYSAGIELANGDASHHLIVYVAVPGSPAESKLKSLPLGHKVPCIAAEMAYGSGLESLGAIQRPYGKVEHAPGLAQRFYSGQRVVWDYHYYNTSEAPVRARSAVNVHLVDRADVTQLMGSVGATNWLIDTPPGETKAFKAECRYEKDLLVGGLTRHTHKWGGDFRTWFAGGPNDGQHIWTSHDYESEIDHVFDEPRLVKKGEGFAFECTFHNDQARSLRFGTAATDEMCILFMPVWDPEGGFEPPKQMCDIVWADASGLGHTASFPDAFPPPTAGEVALCRGGAGEAASECTQCICNACASITVKCFADADCGPIAQCTAPTDCEPVIDAHSSGVGLSRQLGECVTARCGSVCGG